MMSAPARALMGLFGLQLEILGPERTYWNESRAPVRFSLMSAARLLIRAATAMSMEGLRTSMSDSERVHCSLYVPYMQ